MTQAGFPVPAGFIVTAAAYDAFVEAAGLAEVVARATSRLADGLDVSAVAAEAQAACAAAEVPPAVHAMVAASYEQLAHGTTEVDGAEVGHADLAVAVRSSATAEDLPEASFAGQQDTLLNVHGVDAVVEAVRRCWASLWTERAVAYRHVHGFGQTGHSLAVVVQRMVDCDAAGVMFTADPVRLRRDRVVINAAYGLGEGVVSGLVTPDTYQVDRAGRIVARAIADKSMAVRSRAGGAVEERAVSAAERNAPVLADPEVLGLAALGRRVEAAFGAPQDIEWGRRGGELFVLQSRPITTLGPAAVVDGRDDWTRAMFIEILPDAPSPAFCSVLEPILQGMLDTTLEALGQHPPRDIPAVGVFYSQPYLNLRYIRKALENVPSTTRDRFAARLANPFAAPEATHVPTSPADLAFAWRLVRAGRRLPGTLAATVASYRAELATHRAAASGRSPVDTADAIVDLAYRVVPPLIELDFLLIAALGFAERVAMSLTDRSGVADRAAVRGALLSGITGNLTMEVNKALWDLADVARREPVLSAALQRGVTDRARLADADQSGDFTAALGAFLARYGHREGRMDIAWPTWGEDPTPVLGFVRAYLGATGGPGPAELERASAASRAAAIAEVEAGLRASLAGRVVLVRVFRWSVAQVERLSRDRDTMHFYWTESFPVLRALLERLGQAWTEAGLLDDPGDVYCMHLDELPEVAATPRPLQAVVAARRKDWQRDKGRDWPVAIHFGEEIHELGHELPAADGSLTGIAGSPGKMTGTVRVLRGPEDFGRLLPGEVLVAPITTPVWTPLFAVAGGLVTDTGGILSHGAIVAREYGIPAVIGVAGATEHLRDGDVVTVDGSGGTVVLETPPVAPT